MVKETETSRKSTILSFVLFLQCILPVLKMPNIGDLIYNLEKPLKYEIRRFEKCLIKSKKLQLSCAFNDICLNENILPKYTELNLHDKAAIRENFTNEFV